MSACNAATNKHVPVLQYYIQVVCTHVQQTHMAHSPHLKGRGRVRVGKVFSG